VEEEGGSNHVLDPQDIIADPGCRKPIEEMHPNIRDDAKREYFQFLWRRRVVPIMLC
jgi:hypothetical protein